MRPVTDEKEGDEILKGPAALGADGRLEQRFGNVEPAGAPPLHEERLELAEVAPPVIEPRIERFRDEPPRPSRAWAMKLVIGALLLGVVGLVALLQFKPKLDVPIPDGVRESGLLEQLGNDRPPIIISSVPSGATIVIGGKTVGETPWAGENLWAGDTPLILRLTGFQRWEGQIKGGQPVTLDIRLKK